MTSLTFAPDLVEEAVLLGERSLMRGEDVRAFRRERDRIYSLSDDREREEAFRSLHLRYFSGLGLGAVVADVLGDRTEVTSGVDICRVVRALARRDEGADLIDAVIPRQIIRRPALLLRLRPSTLVDRAERLRDFLHHELTHVADMLNPTFGYQRELPQSDEGPSADTILRNRYRVVWDTTIDGRLTRAGRAPSGTREARWKEFASTFGMLDEECAAAFARWFGEDRATHEGILAFATSPSGGARDSGRCPLCRFPAAALDPRVSRMSDAVVGIIRADRPGWNRTKGLCSQCFDLYEARHEERHTVEC